MDDTRTPPAHGDSEGQRTGGATVFVGDSLTAGHDWAAAFPERRVVNLGVDGDTTEQVLERLDAVVALAPATVVLMIGTNDLAWRRTAEQVVRGIEEIIVALRRALPDAHLIVQSVLPRDRDRADLVHEINIHIRQFAPTVKAEFVDLHAAFALDDGELSPEYSDDRLHLNEAGYAVWVERLAPHLHG